jgi:hypothetical protein
MEKFMRQLKRFMILVPAVALVTTAAGLGTAQARPLPQGAIVTADNGDNNNNKNNDKNDKNDQNNQDNNQQDNTGFRKQGPFREDFVDIQNVKPDSGDDDTKNFSSPGTFVEKCGRNEEGHFNSDNVIAAPGVENGAQHLHDYVGNTSTDGFSTDDSLSKADTTCDNNDLSTYYWPVLRLQGQRDNSDTARQSTKDGNIGKILTPDSVLIQFRGNEKNKVDAMPRFLRIITGDAKAHSKGAENARAQWTCSGFENRRTTKYPLCPNGSKVVRILDFPSCWNGKNTDSIDHRSHIVFPDDNGQCKGDFKPVPQLRYVLSYDVPQNQIFALDGFPTEKHDPITDHGDFINVAPDNLMQRMVGCINDNQNCN